MRPVGQVARGKGGGDGGGVIGLLRARLGIGAEQPGEAGARLRRRDRVVAGRRGRARSPPIRRAASRPAAPPHAGVAPGSAGGSAASTAGAHSQPPRSIASAMARISGSLSCPSASSRARAAVARVDAGLGRAARRRQPERLGETARRRHAEPRRIDKGEQLEQVERGEPRQIEPPRGGDAHGTASADRSRPGARASAGDSASISPSGRQPQDFAKAGDQHRRLRHQHPSRSSTGVSIGIGHDRRHPTMHIALLPPIRQSPVSNNKGGRLWQMR